MTRVLVVGDALLDVDLDGRVERMAPDAPVPVVDQAASTSRPGGAALAAALLARAGHEVVLVTAIADDRAGRTLRDLLGRDGVDVVAASLAGTTPQKLRVRADERPLLRIDRGDARVDADTAMPPLPPADAVLVADYGRGITRHPSVRSGVRRLAAHAPVVWDPHPRGDAPVLGTTVATPSRAEATTFVGARGVTSAPEVADAAEALARRWGLGAVAVTLGPEGALLVRPGTLPIAVPAVPAPAGADPCGAGDAFAGALTAALGDARTLPEALTLAVRHASRFVGDGGAHGTGSIAEPHHAGAARLCADVRARGGTVVATSGCFDLLHPGHVATLEAARRLGDCLVVLLNSDDSVRRLKGPARPVVTERDRAAVLRGLACVDAVDVFDEDTPVARLQSLRPHVFVKGGDYLDDAIPEAAVLRTWGGRAVVVPYLDGRSTTELLEGIRGRT